MKYRRMVVGVLAAAVTAVALSTELTRAGGPGPRIVETEKVGVPVRYEPAEEYQAVMPDMVEVPGILRDDVAPANRWGGGLERAQADGGRRGSAVPTTASRAAKWPTGKQPTGKQRTGKQPTGKRVKVAGSGEKSRRLVAYAGRRGSAARTVKRVLIAEREVSSPVVAYEKPTLKQKIGRFFKGIKAKFKRQQ